MNIRPRVFIGSSIEGLEIAQALQINLDYVAEVSLWTDNIFELSTSTMGSLNQILNQVDYSIFVLTPDDLTKSRDTDFFSPRDNVIFELGLFSGKIGLNRTFIVHPRNIKLKIPTDLLGITTATYEEHSSGNLIAALRAASSKIELQIKRMYNKVEIDITWEKLCSHIEQIGIKLKKSPSLGGFFPDAILGISRGGIIIADLLSRYLGGKVPVMCLWADRYSELGKTNFAPPYTTLNENVIQTIKSENYNNLLIVDDISRNGRTINYAYNYITANLPSKTVKTCVVVTTKGSDVKSDFSAIEQVNNTYLMPFSLLG